MNYFIHTYGCYMNYSDTERIKTMLENLGMEAAEDEKDADLIIFNTCSVKQKAEDKVYGQMEKIRRFRKERPNLLVGITGCMVRKTSTRNSEEKDKLLRKMKQLDFVFRIEELGEMPAILKELNPKNRFQCDSIENYFKIAPKYDSTFQAFVPIGTGCDKFCTYCIVPYSRGREKSRHPDEVFKECEKLVKKGCIEITLLGQTVDSYGLSPIDQKTKVFDKKDNFAKLLRQVDTLKSKGLQRLRFSSPHPKDFTEELIRTIAGLETMMPYIHLPVQSGDNEVLKHMNRPYTREKYLEIIKKIREHIPDCAISTDIIVGFCGETKEQFKNTYSLCKEVGFELIYISRYSPRKGTISEKLMEDNVSHEDKAKRWHKLNDLLKKTSAASLKTFVGSEVKVLVESFKDGLCEGKSEHSKEVEFKSDKFLVGQIVPVKVTDSNTWRLIGEHLT